MLCEAFIFDLNAVLKLVNAALEDHEYLHPDAAVPDDGPAPRWPALWWGRTTDGSYLASNGAHAGLGPIWSAGSLSTEAAAVGYVIPLDDDLVMELVTAHDTDQRHLLVLNGPITLQLGATTLVPGWPDGVPGVFTLDEGPAREWLTTVIVRAELDGLDPETAQVGPRIDLDWDPRDPGALTAVDELVRHAQAQHVLTGPPGATLEMAVIDDGDDGAFRVLLQVGGIVPLTVAGPELPLSALGDGTTRGIHAAIALLRDIAATGSGLCGRLAARTLRPGTI